ncbi:MAG: T9SS type A sorting domain-containing protein [Bacteroidota bacterium]
MKVQLLLLTLLLSGALLHAQGIDILLVDDSDDSFDNTALLGNGLTNNGLAFDLFNSVDSTAGPSIDLMADYDLVIWHTSTDGDFLNFWNGDQSDNGNLSLYLEEGGSLWLIGNDFLFNRYGVPADTFQTGDFVYDYLGIAQYDAQAYGDDGNNGVPEVRPAENQPITGLDLIFWQFPTLWWADILTPRAEAITIYEMGHDNYVFAGESTGIWYAGENHRALTFAFDLALANNQEIIDLTVGSVVEFFAGFIVDTEVINDLATAIEVYPNPSSGLATLSFSLAEAADVGIDVVNMLGQPVAQLLPNTSLAAGLQQIEWQPARELPNGLYQFRIAIDRQVVQKGIVLKR